jgi:hypothetical protein
VVVQTLGRAVLQVQPGSTRQVDEQPSPLMVSPSSQVSAPARRPSPHTGLHVDGVPVQVQPVSIRQVDEQPSPLPVLP